MSTPGAHGAKGAVFVYKLANGNWTQIGSSFLLYPSDLVTYDYTTKDPTLENYRNAAAFGYSLSFDYTGQNLVISAPYTNISGMSAGGAWIYQRGPDGSFAKLTTVLLGDNTAINDAWQAMSLSLNGNATILLTSGLYDNCTSGIYNCYGAFYTFTAM